MIVDRKKNQLALWSPWIIDAIYILISIVSIYGIQIAKNGSDLLYFMASLAWPIFTLSWCSSMVSLISGRNGVVLLTRIALVGAFASAILIFVHNEIARGIGIVIFVLNCLIIFGVAAAIFSRATEKKGQSYQAGIFLLSLIAILYLPIGVWFLRAQIRKRLLLGA